MTDLGPLNPEQPSLERSQREKTAELTSLRDQGVLTPTVANAIISLNEQRLARGQRPYGTTSPGNVRAIAAAQTGQAVTEPEEPSVTDFLGNVARNATQIGSILNPITLGRGLVSSFRQLPQMPTELSQAISTAGNPLEALGNIAGTTGFQFVPPSYVVENLFASDGGGWRELARNPLFTALDVTPFLGVGARASRVGRLVANQRADDFAKAAEAYQQQILSSPGMIAPRPPRRVGVGTVLTNRLDEAGNVAPTRFGEVVSSVAEGVGRTRGGRVLREMFGSRSRDVMQMEAAEAELLRQGRPEIFPDEYAQRVARVRDEVRETAKNYDFDDATQAELIRVAERGDPSEMALLPDDQRTFVDITRQQVAELAEIKTVWDILSDEDRLAKVNVANTEEVFTGRQARRISQARRRRDIQARVGAIRDDIDTLDPDITPEQILADINRVVADRTLSKSQHRIAVRTAAENLRARGFNVDEWMKELNKNQIPEMADLPPRAWVEGVDAAEDAALFYGAQSRTRPIANRFVDAYKRGDYDQAAKTLNRMRRTDATKTTVDFDTALTQLRARAKTQRWLRKPESKTFTLRKAEKLADRVRKLEAETVPARFEPLVEEKFRQLLEGKVRALYSDDPIVLDEYLRRIGSNEDLASTLGFEPAEINALRREAAQSWQTLRAEGYDPLFVHTVRPERISEITRPRVVPRRNVPVTSLKERILDFTPSVRNLTLSVEHEAIELLRRYSSIQVADQVANAFGRTIDDLRESLIPRARVIQANNPSRTVNEIVDELIRDNWAPFTDELFPSGRPTSFNRPDLWVPSEVAATIRKMIDPPLSGVEKTLEPLTRVFRASVLFLSPRWHGNNIVGGGMMFVVGTGETNPRRIFELLRRGSKAMKEGDPLVDQLRPQLGLGQGLGQVPDEIAPDMVARRIRKANDFDKTALIYRFKAGRTMRRWLDDMGPVRDKFGNLIERSARFNQQIDDMYRASAFYSGYDKAIAKGLTEGEAITRGIATTRRVLQQWDRMTPLERSIIRTVFPFYGWISHVMSFVTQYPIDHPWRVSIMSNFAEAEFEDWGHGLPQRFFELFGVGGMDSDGEQLHIGIGGANPFQDVGDYIMIQGLVGQTHPAIVSALEAVGVDTRSGTAELYPDVYYDPELGRLAARPQTFGSFVAGLAGNTLPQAELLANLTGISSQWKEVHRTNPDAARRMITSQLGLPSLTRVLNVPQERYKAELARYEEQQSAFLEAIRTGDYTRAQRFPGLRGYLDQLNQIAPEVLERFKPDRDEASTPEILATVPTFGVGQG